MFWFISQHVDLPALANLSALHADLSKLMSCILSEMKCSCIALFFSFEMFWCTEGWQGIEENTKSNCKRSQTSGGSSLREPGPYYKH